MNPKMTFGKEAIEWRRSMVLELDAQGYSQHEIATKLQVAKGTVNSDLAHLKKQARENLQHHLSEVVPQEFQRCMAGIKSNLKQTLEIADIVSDPRVKLQARSIANECYHSIIDLVTNAGIVSEALNYVEKKKERINNLQKAADKIDDLACREMIAAEEEAKGAEETESAVF